MLVFACQQSSIHWLTERLNSLYQSALRYGGQVSLGSGQVLFKNLVAKLLKEAELTDDNHRKDFSKDFYGQLSQMVFNAKMRWEVLQASARGSGAGS